MQTQDQTKSVEAQVSEYFIALGLTNKEMIKAAYNLITYIAFDPSPEAIEYAQSRFGSRHHKAITNFVKLYEQEVNDWAKQEEAIQSQMAEENYELNRYIDAVDDCSKYEGFQIIYPDRIEVRANTTGLGDRIPKKNRKYVGGRGDMRWEYPISMRDKLAKLKSWLPIVEAMK